MCGIAGFAGHGDFEDLKKMNTALVHRGPDDEGYWHDSAKSLFLAHRRLSIIDLKDGAQPMWTQDGDLGVVFNGEIYNHRELRVELESQGHRFRTHHSDTEVLLHGYRQWGDQLPHKLNGMWAFALYDVRRNRLFLSRDRFGKKPLFYTFQNGTFAFASELTALRRHSAVKTSVSTLSLKKYFAYGFIPAPGSLYQKIYKLPAGHNLSVDLDDFRPVVHKYWEFLLDPCQHLPRNAEQVWSEQIRDLLEKAVSRRLMADVPLGVFLSGGIDSSAVTLFAAKAGSAPPKTFSIGFEEASFDESQYASRSAKLFRTDHHLKTLSLEQVRDLLPAIMTRLDEPMGDSSLLPTYLLCRETRKQVTVVLGGDGADELFCGYDPFRALHLAEQYARLVPRPVHRAIRLAAGLFPVSHKNMSFDFKFKRALRGLSYEKKLWNPVWLGPLEPKELDELFLEKIDIEEVYSEAIDCWDSCCLDDIVDKTLQFYTRLYLQDGILVKVDRASMMHSLEVRAPFLDRDLVDLVRTIPSAYKFRNGQSKYILKKALEPLLPASIIHRSKKGFGAPIGRWFQQGGLDLNPDSGPHGLNNTFIRKSIENHRNRSHDYRLFLWNAWVLVKTVPEQ